MLLPSANSPVAESTVDFPRITRGVSRASAISQHKTSAFIDRHYEVVRELGRGAFAQVNLLKGRISGEQRVCKLVSTEGMEPGMLALMKKEVNLLCHLDHPNVVKIFEHAFDEDSQQLAIVLEYLEGGDCFTLMEKSGFKALDEPLVARLMHQCLAALVYCHLQGVVHRDIKPENVMLSDPNGLTCKLIDFGVAAQRDEPKRGLIGTVPYMAPEVAVFAVGQVAEVAKDYTPKADMWSLGITTFELLIGEGPFFCRGDRKESLRSILTYPGFEDLERIYHHVLAWKNLRGEARYFLSQLLQKDQVQRPTAAEALHFAFIDKHRFREEFTSAAHEMIQSFTAYQEAPPLVRCCLFVIAARLGAPDLERFGANFLRMDADGDGKINREELTNALNSLADDGADVNIDINVILSAADLDHSGGINFTEFVAVCLYARHAAQGSLEDLMTQAFHALDDDRDGLVSLEQVRSLFRERDGGSFEWLPQDRPFTLDEWFSCLRTVHSDGPVRSSLLALEVPIVPPQLLAGLNFDKVSSRISERSVN